MFDDLLESTNQKKKTNKGWSVILSGLVQTLILGILVPRRAMPDDAERIVSWGAARPLAASQRASPATPFGERLRKSEGAREGAHGFSLFFLCDLREQVVRRTAWPGRLEPEGLEGVR